ncbi:unnamed protein product [Protopolystoma xenopodis]|uniref:Uncharacterized protein n=1 Tax=Protopolystoma xenopodis TaxID=117903 RepID=A0A3S5B098_9PLAT|nr:unnamed protein product [Protopolystoma xenopodis]
MTVNQLLETREQLATMLAFMTMELEERRRRVLAAALAARGAAISRRRLYENLNPTSFTATQHAGETQPLRWSNFISNPSSPLLSSSYVVASTSRVSSRYPLNDDEARVDNLDEIPAVVGEARATSLLERLRLLTASESLATETNSDVELDSILSPHASRLTGELEAQQTSNTRIHSRSLQPTSVCPVDYLNYQSPLPSSLFRDFIHNTRQPDIGSSDDENEDDD